MVHFYVILSVLALQMFDVIRKHSCTISACNYFSLVVSISSFWNFKVMIYKTVRVLCF